MKPNKETPCYFISEDVKTFVFAHGERVYFNHEKYVYYVDILKRQGHLAYMRIYMPESKSKTVEGWQSLDWINVFYPDELDGRFNISHDPTIVVPLQNLTDEDHGLDEHI